jgi:hypothetical protein
MQLQFPDQEGRLPSEHWQYPPAPPFVVQDCLNILEGAREEGKEGRIREKTIITIIKYRVVPLNLESMGVYFGVLRESRQVRWKIEYYDVRSRCAKWQIRPSQAS